MSRGFWENGNWVLVTTLEQRVEFQEQRISELENTFRHIHMNYGDGSDTCKKCGLDLRDRIHHPKKSS